MRVQVNGRYLIQRVTGVQRYAREIVARLGGKVEVICPGPAAKGLRGHVWEQMVLPWRLRRGLLWSPCTTGPLSISSQIVTIHDCAFFDQAHCFSRAFAAWYQFLVPRLARAARQILTDSEFSKQRIVELCRVPAAKVQVVYCGVGAGFRPHSAEEIAAVRRKLGLPQRYLLCVGSLEPRKNLVRLLAAWQRIQPRLDGVSLVLAGAKSHVFREAGLSQPPAVHLAGYLSDDMLSAVYAGAEAFVFPSLYEGFGLPVLEAMACGTPVVCSATTSLREVAGDAALLVDPFDVESIAEGLTQVLEDGDLRDKLCARGVARAQKFSWDETASHTWDALQSVL